MKHCYFMHFEEYYSDIYHMTLLMPLNTSNLTHTPISDSYVWKNNLWTLPDISAKVI